jgi:uncharacterized protein YqjF (DUF2071 family)
MREFAPPQCSWIMAQTWRDLLFAHWPVPQAELERVVPKPLELDLFDGQAWIAVVPFRMDGIYPRATFPLPWLSETAEINVRTYVTFGGKRGVYFLSLHAANPVAVKIARQFFHLPYSQAAMDVRSEGDAVHYASCLNGAAFQGEYRPAGDVRLARPGTLEYWLTERYCFLTLDRSGRVIRGDVDHPPWPLQPAEASVAVNTMTKPFGIDLAGVDPLLHFARKIEVVVWMPERA